MNGHRPPPALQAEQRKVLAGLRDDEARLKALGLFVRKNPRWRKYSDQRKEQIVEGLFIQYKTRMTPWEIFNVR